MNKTKQLVLSAIFLALTLALPFITGQIPGVGSMLLPMHIPVLLCGYVCGGWWGFGVGLVAPLMRHLFFGMPPLTVAISMTFELAAYGFFTAFFYSRLKLKKPLDVYVSLGLALLLGRVVWGIAQYFVISMMTANSFTLNAFWLGAFAKAWPGIALQVVLIPLLVLQLEKHKLCMKQPMR